MTNRIPTPPDARTVIVGVDTHKHVHVAVAIDSWGIRLRDHAFVVDSGGYQALITWAETHGRIDAFGIEGTGSYGAGLARAVRRAGHRVVEVNRGDRRTRRAAGKSDTLDAEVAARSVLAGQSTAIPKTADGAVEMMRQLKITRDTAVKARTTAMNTLKQIVVHAPPAPREALHDLTDHGLLTRCAGLRPGPIDTPTASAKYTLRGLARRWMALTEEMAIHDQHLARLTTETSPTLRVRRLMREHDLQAPHRVGRAHGPKAHDGTITTEVPDVMWGTDMTATMTVGEGAAFVFVAVDHCTTECIGLHAAARGNRFEALEPIRQGVRDRFGGSGLASELRAQGDFLSVAACEVRPEARKPVTHVHGP